MIEISDQFILNKCQDMKMKCYFRIGYLCRCTGSSRSWLADPGVAGSSPQPAGLLLIVRNSRVLGHVHVGLAGAEPCALGDGDRAPFRHL